MAFKFYVSKSYLSSIKPQCFEEINRNWLKYVETQWASGRGGFLVFRWVETPKEMRPSGLHSPLLFGYFPKFLCYSVGIAEKVSNPLHFPKSRQYPLGFA